MREPHRLGCAAHLQRQAFCVKGADLYAQQWHPLKRPMTAAAPTAAGMLTILATDGSAGTFVLYSPHAIHRCKRFTSASLTKAAPTAACAAGLQIHTHGAWEDVPIIPGTFIINLGGCLLSLTAIAAAGVLVQSMLSACQRCVITADIRCNHV